MFYNIYELPNIYHFDDTAEHNTTYAVPRYALAASLCVNCQDSAKTIKELSSDYIISHQCHVLVHGSTASGREY